MAEKTTIRELLVQFGILDDVDDVEAYDKAIDKVGDSMLEITKIAAALAAGIAAITAGFLAVADSTATYGDEAAKAAQRVGLTAEEFQELKKAAELSGAEVSDLETALRNQARMADEAAQGSAEAAEAFDRLGVSATDENGELKGQLDLFTELAEGLSNVENETERAALASDIFGRGGAKLLPLLNAGAAGIEAMREEARELGIVMSDEAAAQSELFADRLADLKDIGQGLRNTLGLALLPTLTDIMTAMREWFVINRDLIQQKLDAFGQRVAEAFQLMADSFERLDAVVQRIGGWEVLIEAAFSLAAISAWVAALIKLVPLVLTLGEGLAVVLAPVLALGAPEILAALAVFVVLFGALFLVVNDVVTFLQGGESVVGRFVEAWQNGEGILGKVREIFERLVIIAEKLWPAIALVGRVLFLAFSIPFRIGLAWAETLLPVIIFGLDLMIGALDLVILALGALESFTDRVGGAFARLRDVASSFFAFVSEGFNSIPGLGGLLGGSGASAFAPAQVAGGTTSTSTSNQSTSVAGDTINISGLTAEQVDDLIEDRKASKQRQAQAALAGAEL